MITPNVFKGFVTPDGLQQLKKYKYVSGKYTWFDGKMNNFWEWCVTLLPLWIAPNLVTFIGFAFVILSSLIILIYDHTFTQDIPRWCFLFSAISIFIYSTLDAIDGKQARRTKSSSPLGQLFDHGCDAFALTFFILGMFQAFKLENDGVFIIFLSGLINLWIFNWMEYQTGILSTNVGELGVTQLLYTSILFHLLTFVFGQNMWVANIGQVIPIDFVLNNAWLANLKVGTLMAYLLGSFGVFVAIFIIGKRVSQTKRFKQLSQNFPVLIISIAFYLNFNLSIYQTHTAYILVNFGTIWSLIVCKVIISTVTKMKLDYFHSQLLPTIIGTIVMMGLELQQNQEGQIIVFWLLLAINLIMTLNILSLTISQLTNFLGIYCFSLKKRTQSDKKL